MHVEGAQCILGFFFLQVNGYVKEMVDVWMWMWMGSTLDT